MKSSYNEEKEELYEICREVVTTWKSCKILGSLLDTASDINRRKSLEIGVFDQMKDILNSRITSLEIKIRTFKTYIEPISLYNSELWNLIKELKEKSRLLSKERIKAHNEYTLAKRNKKRRTLPKNQMYSME